MSESADPPNIPLLICLDVLRTLAREPLAAGALASELEAARGLNSAYDTAFEAHHVRWPDVVREAEARWFTESLALLLAGAVLLRHVSSPAADAFCATRLVAGGRGRSHGTVAGLDTAALIARLGAP